MKIRVHEARSMRTIQSQELKQKICDMIYIYVQLTFHQNRDILEYILEMNEFLIFILDFETPFVKLMKQKIEKKKFKFAYQIQND